MGSKKRAAIIEFLYEQGPATFEQLKEVFALTRSQLTALCDAGFVAVSRTEKYRQPYDFQKKESAHFVLTEEQQQASDRLCALCDENKANAALLYGVTGSGKTQGHQNGYRPCSSKGARGRFAGAGNISHPQTLGMFAAWYGERIAVIHSGLSAGERFDAWRRIKQGKADVCIGTRSAVFAPFEKLGLIVIDEEQEHTYKSDQNPKYHARDIARFRCAKAGALMLLSSATPSVESYYKAKSGVYHLVPAALSLRKGRAA